MPAMGARCGSLCALQRPQRRMINGYLEDRVKKRHWVFWGLQLLGAAIEAPRGFVPPATPWVAHGDALHGSEQSRFGLGWGRRAAPGESSVSPRSL